MKYTVLFIAIFLFWGHRVMAQDSLSIVLSQVEISDNLLRDYLQTQKTEKLSDSIIKRHSSFLTSLLNYNTLLYFKENGPGGASSVAFRGTTASQTAVVWNGININSQFLGQADFNAFNTLVFNNISVKSGGGSSIYGSSAIGGSIHLNNKLVFTDKFENELLTRYGSFNTYDINFQSQLASEKYSLQLSLAHSASDNDYEWIGKNRKNLNGQYESSSFSASAGYRINDKNTLKLYSNLFSGERHFSLVLPSETPTKYQNFDFRNLLEWSSYLNRFTSRVKLAHLLEEYEYYPDIANDYYTFGKVESLIVKYDLAYSTTNKIKLNTVVDYTQNKGYGSDLRYGKRQIGSGSIMMKHLVTDSFLYEVAARKEVTDMYDSPFLYSVGTSYAPARFYTVKVNASKNFRIPTFNDLYWVTGGNPELKPETSYQAELTHEFIFGGLTVTLTGYYNQIEDMLRWVPTSSLWSPENVDEVEIFGFEGGLSYQKAIGKHEFYLKANYGYTSSKDKRTDKYLMYVPTHKSNAHLLYSYKDLNLYLEMLYVGEVYTRSDNNARYNLDAYQVFNLGGDYTFYKNYTVGVKVQNLMNVYYENVENRPLPGRNFMVYLNCRI